MIETIQIQNYRGIRNCKLKDLKRINVFIGRNNSGKSSILESLYLASAAFNFKEILSKKINNKIDYLLNRRCYRGYHWGDAKEILWYEYNIDQPISVEMKINGKDIKVSLVRTHQHPLLHYQIIGGDYICLLDHNIYNSKENTFYSSSKVFTVVQKFKEEIDFFAGFRFIDNNLIQEMDVVEQKLWKDLLKNRNDKLVVKVLREGYGIDVEDLTYTTYDGRTYQLAVKLPHTSIRVDDLGDGSRYAILLIMIAALSKNTALLIEEAENHQHPSGLSKTLDMFFSIVKRKNIQVFFTTHSLEFLRILKKISEENKIDIGIYFLERDKKGQVDARELTSENIDALESMGFDPRFLDLI